MARSRAALWPAETSSFTRASKRQRQVPVRRRTGTKLLMLGRSAINWLTDTELAIQRSFDRSPSRPQLAAARCPSSSRAVPTRRLTTDHCHAIAAQPLYRLPSGGRNLATASARAHLSAGRKQTWLSARHCLRQERPRTVGRVYRNVDRLRARMVRGNRRVPDAPCSRAVIERIPQRGNRMEQALAWPVARQFLSGDDFAVNPHSGL